MHVRHALHVIIILVISVWPISGSAQTSTRPPREAGLLVGFDSGGTLWLPLHNESLSLAWRAPYLVVPRPDGYWQVASAGRCSLDIDSAHGGGGIGYSLAFREYWQDLAIARVGEESTIRLSGGDDCAAAEDTIRATRVKQFQDALTAAKGDTSQVMQPRPDEDEIGLDCIVSTNKVMFVSANAIAMQSTYAQTEACAPGGYTTSFDNVVRGYAPDSPIRLFSLISRRALAKAPVTSDGGCAFSDAKSTDPSWVPRRSSGRWLVSTFIGGPNACRGGEDVEYELPLPQSFTGEPPLPIAWSALQRAYPSLHDASASPSRTLIALLVADTLIVRRVESGKLGAEIGRAALPSGGDAVMYRWATATESAKWSRDLPMLAPPRVRVVVSPQ